MVPWVCRPQGAGGVAGEGGAPSAEGGGTTMSGMLLEAEARNKARAEYISVVQGMYYKDVLIQCTV